MNLYQLQYIQGRIFKSYQNKKKIGIEIALLKLQKTIETYKNYKNSFYEVGLKAFMNYNLIFVLLLETTAL